MKYRRALTTEVVVVHSILHVQLGEVAIEYSAGSLTVNDQSANMPCTHVTFALSLCIPCTHVTFALPFCVSVVE